MRTKLTIPSKKGAPDENENIAFAAVYKRWMICEAESSQ